MIFDNIDNLDKLDFLDSDIKKALGYAMDNFLISLDNGKHTISGDDIFFNRVSYETKDESEGFWEGHREYIDIHLMLSGRERIDYNQLNKLDFKDYDKAADFASFEGKEKFSIVLEEGDFLILNRDDIHKTGIIVDKSSKVEKVIFKVRIK